MCTYVIRKYIILMYIHMYTAYTYVRTCILYNSYLAGLSYCIRLASWSTGSFITCASSTEFGSLWLPILVCRPSPKVSWRNSLTKWRYWRSPWWTLQWRSTVEWARTFSQHLPSHTNIFNLRDLSKVYSRCVHTCLYTYVPINIRTMYLVCAGFYYKMHMYILFMSIHTIHVGI